MTPTPSLRVAAVLLGLHGAVGVGGLILLLAGPTIPDGLAEAGATAGLLGALYGLGRWVAAAGVWTGRRWAVALGLLLAATSLVVAPQLGAFGVMDLAFALPVAVLLLGAWFPEAPADG